HRARHVAAGYVAVEPRLDLLDVPVGQVAPQEAVDRARGLVEAEALIGLGGLADRRLAARDDPAVGERELPAPHGIARAGERPRRALEVGEDEPPRVPQL